MVDYIKNIILNEIELSIKYNIIYFYVDSSIIIGDLNGLNLYLKECDIMYDLKLTFFVLNI